MANKEMISGQKLVNCNGQQIHRAPFGYRLAQKHKIGKWTRAQSDEELVSVRAAMQYIASCSRPDIAASCQLLASKVGVQAGRSVFNAVNKIVDFYHAVCEGGLKFIEVDLASIQVVLFSDASFANADNYKSQLGFIILLVDDANNANIVDYGSQRCRLVTRSVMAAELHALIVGLDHAMVVASMVYDITGRNCSIDAYIDSKSVFDVIT
jgi:hypothetical protein